MRDPVVLRLDEKPVVVNQDLSVIIEVEYNGKTDMYQCRLGLFFTEARTLAEALHQLANKLDAANAYGSELFDIEHALGRRMKPCAYCQAPMFFALTVNRKWMPVDGRSVTGSTVGNVRQYILIDIAGSPSVRSVSRSDGEVWIAHPEVCGASPKPDNPVLLERWTENNRIVSGVINTLKQAEHDLEEME